MRHNEKYCQLVGSACKGRSPYCVTKDATHTKWLQVSDWPLDGELVNWQYFPITMSL